GTPSEVAAAPPTPRPPATTAAATEPAREQDDPGRRDQHREDERDDGAGAYCRCHDPAQNGAGDPDEDRHEQADRVSAGYQQPGQGTDDGADDDEPQNGREHFPSTSKGVRRW